MATSSGPVQFVAKPPVKELEKRHAERVEKLKNTDRAMAQVATYLDRWVQTNFRTEGGNVGGWKPLKRGGRWVRGRGLDTSAKILQDTGRLRASFTPFHSMLNAGIGSDLPYSRTHEEGIGVPQRRMLPKKKEVWPTVRKIIDSFIKRSLK